MSENINFCYSANLFPTNEFKSYPAHITKKVITEASLEHKYSSSPKYKISFKFFLEVKEAT